MSPLHQQTPAGSQEAQGIDGRALLLELLKQPVGGNREPPQATAIDKPAAPVGDRYLRATRTMDGGYWIDCRVVAKTAKGLQITNGCRTIWLPRSHVYRVEPARIRASDYIVDQRCREIIASDPDGVHERVEQSIKGLKPVQWNHPGGDTR